MDETITGCAGRSVQRRTIPAKGWTKARRQLFLDTLAATCNVRRSIEAAGMTSSGAYQLRRRDPDFAALWNEALAIGYQRLEEALLERALGSVNDIAIGIDADDEGGTIVPGSGFSARRLGSADVQLALSLLNRHRAAAEWGGKASTGRGRARSTPEEIDARLTRQLDSLAKRLKAPE